MNYTQTPAQTPPQPPILDAKRIAEILPHRYPFLLVDRIVHIDLEALLSTLDLK